MKWKDSDDTLQLEDQPEDDYHDEDDYPFWEKPKKSAFFEKLFKKVEIPFVLIGSGLVVLIILFLVSVSGKGTGIDTSQIESIEKRLGLLEDRMFKVEGGVGNFEQIREQENRLNQLQDKTEQLEGSIGLKFDQLISEVTHIKKKMSTSGLKRAVVPKAPAIGEKPGKKRYHQVRTGDTLYGIGRKYGVTIQDLRRLNNFSVDSVIYPGQKIVVGTVKN